MEKLLKAAVFFLAFASTPIFAQTKTEYETAVMSTGHASFTADAKKNGSALEIWVYNNSKTKYTVSFTAEVTLRGEKGEFSKKIKYSGTIAPKGKDYTSPVSIGYANAATDILYISLVDAEIYDFTATPLETETHSPSSNNSNDHNTAINNNSRPSANASVQELAEWQRKQEVNKPTASNIGSSIESQNRLKALQNQQAHQKIQQQANDDHVMAHEEQRQQSMQRSRETVEAITNVVTDLMMQQAEEKRRRSDEEYERQQVANERKEEDRLHREAIATIIANRKNAIAEFPAKTIPLGSQEKARSIYYFMYAYDNMINYQDGATVYVSNVFEVGKHQDGTLPYTTAVQNEIDKLTPFNEVLHGYYYTQQEAEELRQMLISILRQNEVSITEVNYKGRPTTTNSSTAVTDVVETSSKYGKTINLNNDQQTAPAKINTAKPSELPREEKKKQSSKYGKTIKLD